MTCFQLRGSEGGASTESAGLLSRIRKSTPTFGNIQDYDTDDDLIL